MATNESHYVTPEAAETLASEAIRLMADVPGADAERVRDIMAVVLATARKRAGGAPVLPEHVISAVWDVAPWARGVLGISDPAADESESAGDPS
jgi:hypothetical protein